MFTFLSRFRRQTAVLTALAMLASVLVAVPAVAADPIEPDYAASFSACVDAATKDAGFTDVPSGHANAGDINCIAYYGVTKGTSATTYSPLMSVTREHMALFLTRLSGRMGIEVASDPDDAGFTDIGDLSDESQTAINQLADLGITKGTSATTFSPSDHVNRAQMAQFIARVMNQITPIADGELGLSSTTQYGYTPADVENNANDAPIDTPFTDLGRATKDEYDSITQLYELGVATGVSDTSYAPSALITRATMAGFMAGAMGHSNARPAGLSIQATPSVWWGGHDPTVMISMRDDAFMPVEDQAVDLFSSIAGDDALRDDGTCNNSSNPDDVLGGDFADGDCIWNDNDDATDVDGNLITSETVSEGTTRVFYAWIGNSDGDAFDSDKFTAVTASSSARYAHDELMITDTINAHAEPTAQGDKVNLNSTRTVTFTVQLRNSVHDVDVARSGVQIRVEYRQGPETDDDRRNQRSYVNTHEDVLTTDDDGKATFTITGPTPNPNVSGQARDDDVVFTELDPVTGTDTTRNETGAVSWSEEVLKLRKTTLEVPTYVLAGNPSIGAIVRLWDQYGNSHRSRRGQDVDITIGAAVTDNPSVGSDRAVISRGYARWARQMPTIQAGTAIPVSYAGLIAYSRDANGYLLDTNDAQIDDPNRDGTQPTTNHVASVSEDGTVTLLSDLVAIYNDGTILPANALLTPSTSGMVQVVNRANSTHTGEYTVTHVMADDNQYLADSDTTTTNTDVVFTYDSDDTFIDSRVSEGKPISMEKFEALIDNTPDSGVANDVTSGNQVKVQAVIYNIDGVSVFRITSDSAG